MKHLKKNSKSLKRSKKNSKSLKRSKKSSKSLKRLPVFNYSGKSQRFISMYSAPELKRSNGTRNLFQEQDQGQGMWESLKADLKEGWESYTGKNNSLLLPA